MSRETLLLSEWPAKPKPEFIYHPYYNSMPIDTLQPNTVVEWTEFPDEAKRYWSQVPEEDKKKLQVVTLVGGLSYGGSQELEHTQIVDACETWAFARHDCATQARFEGKDLLPSDKHSHFERFYDPWARRKFAGHPDFIMISSDEYQAEREFRQLRDYTNGSKTKGDFESLPRPRLLGAVLTANPYLVTPKGIDHFIDSTSLKRLLY
jgi:hypothetical protein